MYYVVLMKDERNILADRFIDAQLRINFLETELCRFQDYEDASNVRDSFIEKCNLSNYDLSNYEIVIEQF